MKSTITQHALPYQIPGLIKIGTPPAEGTPPPTEDRLVWTSDQEPSNLTSSDPIATRVRSALLEGLYGQAGPDEYYPELIGREPKILQNADGTVTGKFELRDGLVWSDGDDLTADDVIGTVDALLATEEGEDGNLRYTFRHGDRSGLENVVDYEVEGPRDFTITWAEYNPRWPEAVTEVYPMHQFSADHDVAAAELNDALGDWKMREETLVSSGPMVLDSWKKGTTLNLVHNPKYNGSKNLLAENHGLSNHNGVTVLFET